MNRVFRYRLYPTTKQAGLLEAMLGDHCDLSNAALQERREAYVTAGRTVRYGHQCAQLKDVRRADPGGQGRWSFSSQQQTLRRLDKAFAAFFARITRGYPRFRSRGRFDTVTFIHGDGGAWLHDRSRVRRARRGGEPRRGGIPVRDLRAHRTRRHQRRPQHPQARAEPSPRCCLARSWRLQPSE